MNTILKMDSIILSQEDGFTYKIIRDICIDKLGEDFDESLLNIILAGHLGNGIIEEYRGEYILTDYAYLVKESDY